MLHITPEAGVAIAELTESEGVSDGGGIRLERVATTEGDGTGQVMLTVAALAEDTDVTATEENSGAHVFMDPLSAEFVDERTLDVEDTVEGDLRFALVASS
ncbi:hypothetical protein [Labedaea rhizosphaerae]|uniref:Fe-S cluster assembly iron-binding protein IscA n=1 Tax=Labedaea rhizosphaerae TaxID=598644 RepID=A0A4R6SI22_LABRH|nr:hypothetical protein [Labedaea rhizosphaerae]TDQ01475.1 Fe-S cluster assembly iron-binding protein IscA [Labedaea rhizosphaerae]